MKDSLDVVTTGKAMAIFVTAQTGELADMEQFIKHITDAGLSVATGLVRLSLKVGWVSRVDNDSFGCFVIRSLEREGIGTQEVTQDERYATGFQLKSRVENGTGPIVECLRKGSTASHPSIEDYHEAYFASARHLYLSSVAVAFSASSYELLAHIVRAIETRGKTIPFDPSLRPVLQKSEAEMVEKSDCLAFQADWAPPGLKEGVISAGQRVSETIAGSYLHHGVRAVIVKTGADGAWHKIASGEQGYVASIKINNMVNVIGAGDGFAMDVISALLEGHSLCQVVTRGNKIGASAIQAQGDGRGLLAREQLGK